MQLQFKRFWILCVALLFFFAPPSLWSISDIERVTLRLTIRPTLMLRVVPTGSRGGSDLDLGTFYPGDYGKSPNINDFRSVILSVTSNLGMRYQVFQEASGPLQTDDGQTIPEGSFRVFTIGGSQTKGRTLHPEVAIPVTQEPLLLFTSDEEGTSDFFTCGYILDPDQERLPTDQPAGIYTTTLTYTVSVL